MSLLSKTLPKGSQKIAISAFIIVSTNLVLSQPVQGNTSYASQFPNPVFPVPKDAFATLNSTIPPNSNDMQGKTSDRPRNPSNTANQWHCEAGKALCICTSSTPQSFPAAAETCSALGGTLPNYSLLQGRTSQSEQLMESKLKTYWISFHVLDGKAYEFDADTNSPATYAGDFVKTEVFLQNIARRLNCFIISPSNVPSKTVPEEHWQPTIKGSKIGVTGYMCESPQPFLCVTPQATFNETQRKLKLPLNQVINIELQRRAGPDPGTEVLRCVPKFQYAYDYLKDRPSNIVWILDGYYPKEGIKHGGHNATMTVPYEHFTKYACEVRYLGSFYGNRSQEIEVATPSRCKVGCSITVRNASHSPSPLFYELSVKKLVKEVNNDPALFNLSIVNGTSFEQNGSDLVITFVMLSDPSQGREQGDMIHYEEEIKLINELLIGGNQNQGSRLKNETLKAIKLFSDRVNSRTLAGVQLFSMDRCPLEMEGNYSWNAGVGEVVKPNWTGDEPAETCLREDGSPVARTCTGSQDSAAEWVETFSSERNCSRTDETTSRILYETGTQQVVHEQHTSTSNTQLTTLTNWNETTVEPTSFTFQEVLNVNPSTSANVPNGSTDSSIPSHGSNPGSQFDWSLIFHTVFDVMPLYSIVIIVVVFISVICILYCCFLRLLRQRRMYIIREHQNGASQEAHSQIGGTVTLSYLRSNEEQGISDIVETRLN